MTWTASRPRRRARRSGGHFRDLGWVLVREAAAAIMWPRYNVARPGLMCLWLCRQRTDVLKRACARLLTRYPERRIRP